MRMARIKLSGRTAVYHCVSRVVGGQYLLDQHAKEKFRILLWRQAEFCGIQILTYCLLTNHIHILARVPEHTEISDPELIRRTIALYGRAGTLVGLLTDSFNRQGKVPEDLRQRLIQRMGDVSVFMKELKQRFSKWYNRQTGRYGTLWAERFKSTVVEDQPEALTKAASYIDLNPVRANLVRDPKDYRWSGYGEAMGGNAKARAGICLIEHQETWRKAAVAYRKLLYLVGAISGHSDKVAMDPAAIRQVLAEGGRLTEAQALRLRIRYFTDGVVLGSEGFVNEIFAEFRDRFGPRRRTGARKMPRLPFDSLRTLRNLKVEVLG